MTANISQLFIEFVQLNNNKVLLAGYYSVIVRLALTSQYLSVTMQRGINV